MTRERFYSSEQIKIMGIIDPLARERRRLPNPEFGFICMDCGTTDVFRFKSKTTHIITNGSNGLILEPDDIHAPRSISSVKQISIPSWWESQYNRGIELNPICGRCGGACIDRGILLKHCKDTGCLGCMFCGKVAPLYRVEFAVNSCVNCMGGDLECEASCPNEFMRKYYVICDTTSSLLKAPENYEE